MKQYKKILFVTLTPYIFLLLYGIFYLLAPYVPDSFNPVIAYLLFLIFIKIFSLVAVIPHVSAASRGKLDCISATKLNLFVQAVLFPFDILTIITNVCVNWFSASDISFTAVPTILISNTVPFIFTYLISIAAILSLKNENKISKKEYILYIILSLFFVADLVVAIILWKKVKLKSPDEAVIESEPILEENSEY